MPDVLLDADVLRAAVQLACRAPSLHNSQPWQWVAQSTRLHLYVDHSRILYSTDKSGREAYISCSTIYVLRWPQPGGQRTSTDFPIRRTSIMSRHLISAQ